MAKSQAQEQAKYWRAHEFNQLELMRARFVTHAFAPHTHNTFVIGVIEAGVETFTYRRKKHVAPSGSIVVINPAEMHTGEALDERGWAYRTLYPDPDLLRDTAASAFDDAGAGVPFFAQAVIQDPYAAGLIAQLHHSLTIDLPILERQSRFVTAMAALIGRHSNPRPAARTPNSPEPRAVSQARDYLEQHYAENVSLDDLAAVAHLSPYHLLRTFRSAIGLTPHAYFNQLRVFAAKRLLAQGMPLATVSAEVGFVDQSHLNRHFKRIVGVTPGHYAHSQATGFLGV